MLTSAQIASRDGKLTASRVACLMSGDKPRIMNLWRELIGDPAYEPEDLSGVWAVQLGSTTEQLNLDWFARKHGAVSRRGEVVIGDPSWMACTLDGWSDAYGCPIECKHVGGREPLQTVIDRYQPQMHWQMMITAVEQCALSIIVGANEPIVEFIELNMEYATELRWRAGAFMVCVETMRPPVELEPVAAPVIPIRIVDMTGNNEWAAHAAEWLSTNAMAKRCKIAETAIKQLVPPDAIKATGHGVQVTRNRAGSLSLKEQS